MTTANELLSGRQWLSQGKAEMAHDAAERVLSLEPQREEAWTLLIDSWMARRRPAQAAAAAVRAVEAAPGSDRLLARLMMCRLHQGDLAAADAAAEDLWGRDPQDLDALTMLGQVGAALDRHELARAAFERASAIRPNDPQLLFNLATSLRNFGEFERAESLYDQVIRSRPEDWEAYKNRSELRRQTLDKNHVDELEHAVERAGADWRGGRHAQLCAGQGTRGPGPVRRCV